MSLPLVLVYPQDKLPNLSKGSKVLSGVITQQFDVCHYKLEKYKEPLFEGDDSDGWMVDIILHIDDNGISKNLPINQFLGKDFLIFRSCLSFKTTSQYIF